MKRRDLLLYAAQSLALGAAASARGAVTTMQNTSAAGPHVDLPTYRCRKVASFTPDGDPGKEVWRNTRAVRLVSATGRPQRLQPTEMRCCWSDIHLYTAFRCASTVLHCTYTQRDEPLYNEDVVEVFLSPTGDLQHYIELEFNAREAIFDAHITNQRSIGKGLTADTAWNCNGLVCHAQLHTRDKEGSQALTAWTVEVAIPFAGLEISPPNAGDRWRANFYRIDYSKPIEYSAWSPTLAYPANYHVPERFGWLEFEGAK